MPERHELTELQLSILRLLWQRGEATVAELWEALYERARPRPDDDRDTRRPTPA